MSTLDKDATAKKTYTAFTFNDNNIHMVTNIFRKQNLNIAFKTTNNNASIFYNTQAVNPYNRYLNSGVYKLKCNDCEATYVDQTGRNFSMRYSEHVNASTYNRFSAIAQHMEETNHHFTTIEQDMDILKTMDKGLMLNISENYYIDLEQYFNPNYNLNEITEKSNILFDIIILEYRKHKLDNNNILATSTSSSRDSSPYTASPSTLLPYPTSLTPILTEQPADDIDYLM